MRLGCLTTKKQGKRPVKNDPQPRKRRLVQTEYLEASILDGETFFD